MDGVAKTEGGSNLDRLTIQFRYAEDLATGGSLAISKLVLIYLQRLDLGIQR